MPITFGKIYDTHYDAIADHIGETIKNSGVVIDAEQHMRDSVAKQYPDATQSFSNPLDPMEYDVNKYQKDELRKQGGDDISNEQDRIYKEFVDPDFGTWKVSDWFFDKPKHPQVAKPQEAPPINRFDEAFKGVTAAEGDMLTKLNRPKEPLNGSAPVVPAQLIKINDTSSIVDKMQIGATDVLAGGGELEDARSYTDNYSIKDFPKEHGLFGPIKEEMAGPLKEPADRATKMTHRLKELYDSGDPEVRAAVLNFERKTLGAGYADNEAGRKLTKESLDMWGSKDKLSKHSAWDAFMSFYGDNIGDYLERDDINPEEKKLLEGRARFDREGRASIDYKKFLHKLTK